MTTMIDAETLTLAVTGMTCGSCKHRVETALNAVPGVSSAAVNVASGTAEISCDPATATPEGLIGAVRALGYGAEAVAPERKSGLPLAPSSCSCCASH